MKKKQKKQLYRSSSDRLIAGVFGGLAQYSHLNSTFLRVLFAIITVLTGVFPGALLYVVMVIIIPPAPNTSSWFNLFRDANATLNRFQQHHKSAQKAKPRQLHHVKVDDVHDDGIESGHH